MKTTRHHPISPASRRALWLTGLLALAPLGAACSSSQNRLSAAVPIKSSLAVERDAVRAALSDPKTPQPGLARQLGLILLADGAHDEAERTLSQAQTQGSPTALGLFGLALLAQERGQHSRAQSLWVDLLDHVTAPGTRPADAFDEAWHPALAEVAAYRLLVGGVDGSTTQADLTLAQRLRQLWSTERRSRLPIEAQQFLAAFLGQILRLQGDETTALALDGERGCAPVLYVTGPHGRYPALDLFTQMPADDPRRDDLRARYQRKDGSGCSVTLEGIPSQPGVMHAVTWIHVDGKKQVQKPLVVESGGGHWALFIDGKLTYSEQDPQRRRMLTLSADPGWHALSLKVGVGGRTQVQISGPGLTFFDKDPKAAPAVSGGGTVSIKRREPSAVPPASALWTSALRAYVLAQQAAMVGDAEAGLSAIDEVQRHVPRFAALSLVKSALLLDDRSRPERLLRDQARAGLEQTLAQDPTLLRVRMSLALLRLQDDHAAEAQELLEAAPRSGPGRLDESWQAMLLFHRILKARNWTFEAERALHTAARVGASACGVLEALSDQRREREDVAGALAWAQKLARCNPYSDQYADQLADASRYAEAEAEYLRLLKLEPESESWLAALARLYAARRGPGDLDRALALRQDLVKKWPRNVTARSDLANLLVEKGQPADAKRVIQDGLSLMPESGELDRLMLALGVPSAMDPLRVDGLRIIHDFKASQSATKFQGEPAVVVLDRTVVRVLPTGARQTLTHNIIWVLNKDGLEKFGEVKVPDGADVLTLRTIKKNGSTAEPESIPEKDTVSAPDLEVGEFVEFEYVTREAPLVAFGRGFLAERFYFASPDAPLDRSEYVFVAPSNMDVQIDLRGPLLPGGKRAVPVAIEKREGDEKILTWRLEHVGRLQPEPPMAEAIVDDWIPSVRIGSGLFFAEYVSLLRERRVRTLLATKEVAALAKQLVGEPISDEEAARAPFDVLIDKTQKIDFWVRKNIQAGGSLDEQASSILARREGRRDVLLMALLRAAGIPCELWLVRPLNAPALDGPLPDLMAYGEALVAVAPGRRAGGQPVLFVEPSARHMPTGYVRAGLRGARALRVPEPRNAPPLPEATFTTVAIPPIGGLPASATMPSLSAMDQALRDQRHIRMRVQLSPDGSGDVTVREELAGWAAVEWRDHVENQSEDKLRQELEQRALGFYFPGASLSALTYGPVDNDSQSLVLEYRFTAPQLVRFRGEKGQGEMVLSAPYPALLSRNYVRVASRTLPLLVQYMPPTVVDVTYVLPKGAQVLQILPPIEQAGFGRFVQRVTQEPGVLTLHAELAMEVQRVPPERYPALMEYAKTIDSAELAIALVAVDRSQQSPQP